MHGRAGLDEFRTAHARLVCAGLGGGAHGESVAVALAKHQRARAPQARHRRGVVRRHVAAQRRGARRRRQARRAQRVLRAPVRAEAPRRSRAARRAGRGAALLPGLTPSCAAHACACVCLCRMQAAGHGLRMPCMQRQLVAGCDAQGARLDADGHAGQGPQRSLALRSEPPVQGGRGMSADSAATVMKLCTSGSRSARRSR